MTPTQPTREERCEKCPEHPYCGKNCNVHPCPCNGSCATCHNPAPQENPTPNREVDEWASEFDERFPFARIIIPSAHGDNIISSSEVKNFIRHLLSQLLSSIRGEIEGKKFREFSGISNERYYQEGHNDALDDVLSIPLLNEKKE